MSRKNRKKKPRRKKKLFRKKQTGLPAYSIGSAVRVKRGVVDPDFEDIPLGGWAGLIRDIDDNDEILYLVEWDQRTLDQMHPVIRLRSERDGFDIECMWLREEDLEPRADEPVIIEQPTNLIHRPLSDEDPDDRIRAIFGLTSDDPVPLVTEENLRRYRSYLASHLSFPFAASFLVETDGIEERELSVTVIGLLDDHDITEGLYCEATDGSERVELCLVDLEVVSSHHDHELIDDYGYWFYEYGSASSDDDQSISWLPIDEPPVPWTGWMLFWATLLIGLVGGIVGIPLGAIFAAAQVVQIIAIVGAIVGGLVGYFVGTRLGRFLGVWKGVKHGRLLGGILGTLVGIILGALLGAMLAAIVGLLIGGVLGALFSKWFLRPGRKWIGVVLGPIVGATAQAFYLDHEMALEGAIYGATIGLFAGMAVSLALLWLLPLVGRARNRS